LHFLILDDQEERLPLLKKALSYKDHKEDSFTLINPRFFSMEYCIKRMKQNDVISFDNDVGENFEIYNFLKKILYHFKDTYIDYKWMNTKTFYIHSKNVVAAQNIYELLILGFRLEKVYYLTW
jgi:hypothetical protein